MFVLQMQRNAVQRGPARRLFAFPERTPCDLVPPTNDSPYGGVGRSKSVAPSVVEGVMKDWGRAGARALKKYDRLQSGRSQNSRLFSLEKGQYREEKLLIRRGC